MNDDEQAREELLRLDEAFLRLRRLWSATRQNLVLNDGVAVDMSGLLIVEACAQGEAHQRLVTVGQAARFMDVAPSTASRLVDRACEAGLVVKEPAAGGSRRVCLRLTVSGRALRKRALAARLSWLRGQLAGWPGQNVEVLGQLLLRFADELDMTPGTPTRPAVALDDLR